MLHQLRIPALGLMIIILCQILPSVTAVSDNQESPDFTDRCAALAGQLASLREPGASSGENQVLTTTDTPGFQAMSPDMRAGMLADSLQKIVLDQSPSQSGEVKGTSPFLASENRDVMLPQLSALLLAAIDEQTGPEAVAATPEPAQANPPAESAATPDTTPAADENTGAPEVAEEASSDLEDAAAAPAENVEEPSAEPLPPAPRVQTSPQVKDSNASLVTRLHDIKTEDASAVPEGAPSASEAPGTSTSKPVRPERRLGEDPLDQLVNIDFRETDLTHVVAVLALKADINIIAGADLQGTVTANLQQVPLRIAIETVLRMNGLGVVEEDGIYFIVPYEEAASVNRKTTMVTLENAKAEEIKKVLDDIVKGIRDEALISISANKTANVLVISAPKNRVEELLAMASQLDVAEPVLPTITEAISLNYSEPADMMPLVEKMLTEKVGQVSGDKRARHLVVTDVPVVVEQVKELIKKLDVATKQVLIESMVVDAILNDEADTGIKWLMDSLHRFSRREAALGEDGKSVGILQELGLGSDMSVLQKAGSLLTFSVLTDKIDWTGVVEAEIRNRNGRLLSNPSLLTLENESADIAIAQEVPYTELTQTGAGGQQTSTRFKEIGTTLKVMPRVTHDNNIICEIEGKESTTNGQFQGVPIEDKREISSTMRMGNGQTIFIGGLRKSDGSSSIKKIPILGDVPVVNFMFRSTQRKEQINELLVFLTCSVMDEEQKLTPRQQEVLDTAPPIVPRVDAWETLMHDTAHPEDTKEIQMRWRRGS